MNKERIAELRIEALNAKYAGKEFTIPASETMEVLNLAMNQLEPLVTPEMWKELGRIEHSLSAQDEVSKDKQVAPHMNYSLSNILLNNGWSFDGDNPHGSIHEAVTKAGFLKHEHPNLDVPIEPDCSAKLNDLGDDRGQGLDGYWKWGFRAGWHYAMKKASAPSPALALEPVTSDLTREQQENSEFHAWWESSGQKAGHDLRTENAAHATWQERASRANSEADESAYLIDRLGKLLAGVAVALNGPEPALTRWSYHDLPEKATKLMLELEIYRSTSSPSLVVRDVVEREIVAWAAPDGDEWVVYGADSQVGEHIAKYQTKDHGVNVFPIYRDCKP